MRKIFFKLQNKFWLLLVSFVAVSLAVPNLAWAGAAETIGSFIGNILYFIMFIPFAFLLKVEMIILPIVAQYNNFTNQSGVVAGWVAARDLVNMLFIVILLIIAFGTILKIQSYGYKQLLRQLIIMALLVNFSRTIVGFVIDLFQLIMLTFVSAIKDVAAGNIAATLGIADFVNFAETSQGPNAAGGLELVGQIIMGYLVAGVMMVMASIVVMAFIVTLVSRIVMLWIVIVLSPIAFLANTFPKGQSYFQKWMEMFTKELVVGPVLAFFLWLSFMIVGKGTIKDDFPQPTGATTTGFENENSSGFESQGIGPTKAGQWDNILTYIVGIAMLIGALKVTSSFGSVAGGIGAGLGNKMQQKISTGYRKMGSFAGGKAVAPAVGLGGIVAAKVGAGLEKSGSKRLRTMGTTITALEQTRRAKKEEGTLRNKFADKYVKGDKAKEAFFAGAIGGAGSAALYKAKTANNSFSSPEEVKKGRDVLQSKGYVEDVKKLESTHASLQTAESAEGTRKEKGVEGYSQMGHDSYFNSDGSLSEGGGHVLDQVGQADAKAQEKFFNNPRMTAEEQDSLKTTARTKAMSGETPVMTKDKDDANGKLTVDKENRAYKMASFDMETFAALLNTAEFDPEHEDNKGKPEAENLATEKRAVLKRQLGPQVARRVKDEDLHKIDNKTLATVGSNLSTSQIKKIVEASDDDRSQVAVSSHVKENKNVEVFAKDAATAKFVKAAQVGSAFQKDIEYNENGKERSPEEQAEKREQLANDNPHFASEAFKEDVKDNQGKVVDRKFSDKGLEAFKNYVSGLSAPQALKIDAAELRLVFLKLPKILQDALMRSGISEKGRGGKTAKADNTDNQDDNTPPASGGPAVGPGTTGTPGAGGRTVDRGSANARANRGGGSPI